MSQLFNKFIGHYKWNSLLIMAMVKWCLAQSQLLLIVVIKNYSNRIIDSI